MDKRTKTVRRVRKSSSARRTREARRTALPTAEEEFTLNPDDQKTKMTKKTPPTRPKGRAVTHRTDATMNEFVRYIQKLGLPGLRSEFAQIKGYVTQDTAHTAFDLNADKNRYRDVVCLDSSRVVLTLSVPPQTDYVHANRVVMDSGKVYIATQAPIDATIGDFWRMIYQESVAVILMLCNLFENGRPRCAQYWPENEGENKTYNTMIVINKKVAQEDKFDTITLEVLPETCAESVTCKLVRMNEWPDRGVPQSGMTILRMLRMIKHNGKPSVVHCSAGIGRTGTAIAIDVIITDIYKQKEIKVPDIVKRIRDQRASCVQTEAQYVFIYSTVLDYIKAKQPDKYRDFVNSFHEEVRKAGMV